jgi:hypothetical protein
LRHPSWGEVGSRACNENDTVNGYLGDQLRRKVATLSPLTKTVNEILTSIRSLPLLVLVWGGSAGLIGYGWLNGQPLWALAAGVLYGIIVNWQLADRDYQMQKAVLVLLGMTRHEALQQAQALEAAAVESEPDDADEDNDEDEDEADDKPWKYPSA